MYVSIDNLTETTTVGAGTRLGGFGVQSRNFGITVEVGVIPTIPAELEAYGGISPEQLNELKQHFCIEMDFILFIR
nr:10019_t:CDS:2 [Entrophospora candida]